MVDVITRVKDAQVETSRRTDAVSALHQDGPPKSKQQIAAEWDAAYSAQDPKALRQAAIDLAPTGLAAYAAGGTSALGKLQEGLNQAIVADKAGPVFVMRDRKIEVHNVQILSDADANKLTASERAELGALATVAGPYANVRELTDKIAFDKPEVQGIKLQLGQKLSAEYPSEYVIAKALQAGGLEHKDWMASNPEQKYLTSQLGTAVKELPNLPKDILDGTAQTGGVDKVNKFLADHDMNIRLAPIGKTDTAMAAVLSLKGAWQGRETTMNVDGEDYPAALVKHVETFKKNGVDVVKLYGKNGINVYAAPMGDDKLTSFQVTQKAQSLTPDSSTERGNATMVLMPKVHKDVQTDLTGIKGMSATDGTMITQAMMQTKLDIDQNGFSATQGVAFATGRSLEQSTTLTLDKPFVVWATAEGLSQPLFASAVEKKYWKDPKRSSDK